MATIREQIEYWARWRFSRQSGGVGKSMLQRVLEGMPGTHCPTCGGRGRAPGALVQRNGPRVACPTCSGSGRVKLDANDRRVMVKPCPACKADGLPRGEVNGRTCFRCRGRGLLVVVLDKVNPAFIRNAYHDPDNPTLQRIDRLVCELDLRADTRKYHVVLWEEYCGRAGNQETKAARLGLGHGVYRKRLQRAVDWIEHGIRSRLDARDLPFKPSWASGRRLTTRVTKG